MERIDRNAGDVCEKEINPKYAENAGRLSTMYRCIRMIWDKAVYNNVQNV